MWVLSVSTSGVAGDCSLGLSDLAFSNKPEKEVTERMKPSMFMVVKNIRHTESCQLGYSSYVRYPRQIPAGAGPPDTGFNLMQWTGASQSRTRSVTRLCR